MAPLAWGILSTARINRRFVPALRSSAGSLLRAVASRRVGRAREFAQRWEIPNSYGSYRALLEDPSIDAVYIPLPNHLHRRWCIAAARAGKHVLCEKPLGLSLDEVTAMQQAADEHGVRLVEGFQFLTHPFMAALKKELASPTLGKLRLVRGYFCYTLSDPENVRLRYRRGGGALWDIGCYPVRFMLDLLKSGPRQGQAVAVRNSKGVDLTFAGQMIFPGDVVGQFYCSFLSPYSVGAEVIFENGRVIANDAWRAGLHEYPPRIRVELEDGTKEYEGPNQDPFLTQIQAFERLVSGERGYPFGPETSRQTVAVLQTLRSSAVGGGSRFAWE